jgi:predicted ribosomally synthesized peptide with nif11-like leader
MSKEEITRFQKDVKNSKDLQEKLIDAGSDVNKIISIANSSGYNLNKDELVKFADEAKSELNDEDLEKVAGGGVLSGAGVTVVVSVI